MLKTHLPSKAWVTAPFSCSYPRRAFPLPQHSRVVAQADSNKDSTAQPHHAEILAVSDNLLARRDVVTIMLGSLACMAMPAQAAAPKYEQMDALKGKDYGKVRTKYPDYVMTDSGLQYKDLRDGSGDTASEGSRVTIDWDGYTLGYYGRPFEARNKSKGGAFVGDTKDFLKFTVGDHSAVLVRQAGNWHKLIECPNCHRKKLVIPAIEEAMVGMKVGGVRRLIVPQELGYPGQPPDFTKQGPTPGNFSGRRALDFVLKNQGLIDKTLLFDIELMRINQ